MSGAATNAQIAAFLTALRMKGETVEELIGFAQVMRQKVVQGPHARRRGRGRHRDRPRDADRHLRDRAATPPAPSTSPPPPRSWWRGRGSRWPSTATGRCRRLCGSADVVETLGINIELTPAQVARCVDEVGIGFLYAPLLHTAMKHVMAARREMGVRTVFNMLGPLTNPAGANAQVIGVYAGTRSPSRWPGCSPSSARSARSWCTGPTASTRSPTPARARSPRCTRAWCAPPRVRPEDFGVPRASIGDLQGGRPRGERRDHPRRPRAASRARGATSC